MYNEYFGDLWEFIKVRGVRVHALAITTNGFVKKNGEGVMGRGCAKQAAFKYPELPERLGLCLRQGGNHVWLLKPAQTNIVSFPVKHNWWERADLALIERSMIELNYLASAQGWNSIVLPRPGCGNGQLSWSKHVKKLADKYLDERYTVVDYG